MHLSLFIYRVLLLLRELAPIVNLNRDVDVSLLCTRVVLPHEDLADLAVTNLLFGVDLELVGDALPRIHLGRTIYRRLLCHLILTQIKSKCMLHYCL